MRTSIRIAAVLVIIIAIGVFAYVLTRAVFYAPDTQIAVPPSATSTAQTVSYAQEPARLRIPAVNINATVQDLGINALGNMQAPDNFVQVGWYKYGPAPGQVGSAVIDGHVDNGLGLAGVFIHLDQIKVGDDVYVDTNASTTYEFVVTDIESYPYQNVPTDLIFNQNDAARLNIITCEGTWVPGGDTYDHRLVVFTKLVSD